MSQSAHVNEPRITAMFATDGEQDELVVSAKVLEVFMVLERQNGHWSPAAKILHVFDTEIEAEAECEAMKMKFPLRNFGVAALRSEAQHVAKPVQIVRAEERLGA